MVTIDPSPSTSSALAAAAAPEMMLLRLKRRAKKKVSWKDGTVDNESLGRKSFKKCSIFHKEVPFNQDCSDDEADVGRRDPPGDGSCSPPPTATATATARCTATDHRFLIKVVVLEEDDNLISFQKIYGDRFDNFIGNFEKSFGSTPRTLHLLNEAPVCEQDFPQCSYSDYNPVAETKLSGADSQSQGPIHEVQQNAPLSSMNKQITLHAGVNQRLVQVPRSRFSPECDQDILNVFERFLNEQVRSNEP